MQAWQALRQLDLKAEEKAGEAGKTGATELRAHLAPRRSCSESPAWDDSRLAQDCNEQSDQLKTRTDQFGDQAGRGAYTWAKERGKERLFFGAAGTVTKTGKRVLAPAGKVLKKKGKELLKGVKEVFVSRSKSPKGLEHLERTGQTDRVLTIDRPGVAERRRKNMEGVPHEAQDGPRRVSAGSNQGKYRRRRGAYSEW